MFTIEYQVIDYSGNHVGSKTMEFSKEDFMALGEFLTKVNKLKERTPWAIQELLMKDEPAKNVIRESHYSEFETYTDEEKEELDEEMRGCISDQHYSDEYYHLVYEYLDIEAETSMGDNMYYLGKSKFYEKHKGKDYEWTF